MKSKNYSENVIKVFKKHGFVLSEPDVLLDSIILFKDQARILES